MKCFDFLLPERGDKPRKTGITMVLDKGLGYETAKSLMEISGEYVDLLKFGWGTIMVQDRDVVKKKIEMYKSFDIIPYTGGTLFEIAYMKNKTQEFFKETKDMGFEAIEISDGSIDIPHEEKLGFITQAKNEGFYVLSEVGKKDIQKDADIDLDERIELIKAEISSGSDKVIIEAREGGKSIGIFDDKGIAKDKEVDSILNNLPSDKIIWEAPNKDQQVYFVLKVGNDVNLGNISSEEIISLETIRRGLRGDTIELLE
ncbi:phosphosulfolactate synthase [Methanobrevibacter cuticularis]|uniref:Phosphosulfolactate synthase n=1 Tax=Methanobrevibacter cuticularis TaxID=47311 RepID=A0A166CPE3_9EURY|nr:phosphosulfolactate synthase [Methanobrevibacter cuticularis]KZX15797.1 phosphosulfolactate synthase [Methanobrevibacter cuticularis]